MGMVVRTNAMAINANRQLGLNNSAVSKSLEKLSSGFKINRAADDASGLAISEKMKAQIKGLEQASANSQDGISLIQTAEGGAQEIHDMLNRMTELATKSANGTIQDDVDREAIQREVNDLNSEITRISKSTNFNGINLLDGSLGGGAPSADGASFTGSTVAKFAEATKAFTDLADWSGAKMTITGTDTFSVDGQTLTIDWTKGEAAGVASALNKNLAAATADETKDIAKKLTDLFNNQMKEQGLSGSVKVSSSGAKKLTITSNNKGAESEVSFKGSTLTADLEKGVGALLFGSTKGEAITTKGTATYNGDTIAAKSQFLMNINGVKLNITTGVAYTKGTTGMDAIATDLQTQIQSAVDAYNTAMGLTAGTKDPASGLTGLTKADFTVEAKDGAIVVKYAGDEKVNFSFGDVGEKDIAGSIGLAGGSSTSGGSGGLTLQVGDTGDAFNKVTVSVDDLSANGIGTNGLDVSNQAAASNSISTIKAAINQVSTNRANLGSLQNRLEHTINNLDTTAENMTAANSRIRDTDMAKEMMNYTKSNVLVQAAQAMLAQANQNPQSILQLLQ